MEDGSQGIIDSSAVLVMTEKKVFEIRRIMTWRQSSRKKPAFVSAKNNPAM